MKSLLEYIEQVEESLECPSVGDIFEIEIARDETLIETYVVDVVEDGIVLEADDTLIRILEHVGYLIENPTGMPPVTTTTSPIHTNVDKNYMDKDRGATGRPDAKGIMDTKPIVEPKDKKDPKDYLTKEDQGVNQRVRNDAFAELNKATAGAPQDLEQQANDFRQRAKAGQTGPSAKWSEMSPAQQEELRRQGFGPQKPTNEAKYRGREVPLGKKMAGDVKKSKVYVRKPNGNIVKVEFGDPNMRIKKSNPKRRKSFRARHNCANPGPRWKARYWSCRAW